MQFSELIRFSTSAVLAHRLRSGLTALGIAVGIAAVVLLTSIGEGVHQYVLKEFTQFGTNLVGVNPGKSSTHGVPLGIIGTVRPLTLEDADAMKQAAYGKAVVPFVQGNAEMKAAGRSRRGIVMGVGPEFPTAYTSFPATGRFLPPDDQRAARAFAVLGSKMKTELFGNESPIGALLRVGGDRYRVIGAMEPKGQFLGIDLDDSVFIPAGRALELFNRTGLMEIDLLYREGAPVDEVVGSVRRILKARHGRDDFTIVTQQEMLDVLGSVLGVLTFAVGALGGISLFVGGVGILTIMTISVRERTAEIGLLRALGATKRSILVIFLGETILLAAAGGLAGLFAGAVGAQALHAALPALPVKTTWSYAVAAEALAVVIGLMAGILPARRAANFDPVEALRAE